CVLYRSYDIQCKSPLLDGLEREYFSSQSGGPGCRGAIVVPRRRGEPAAVRLRCAGFARVGRHPCRDTGSRRPPGDALLVSARRSAEGAGEFLYEAATPMSAVCSLRGHVLAPKTGCDPKRRAAWGEKLCMWAIYGPDHPADHQAGGSPVARGRLSSIC